VEDELLEIPSIYQLLELFIERAIINGTVSHSIMESAVFSDSGTFWLGEGGLARLTHS